MSNTIFGPKGDAAIRQVASEIAGGVADAGKGFKLIAQKIQEPIDNFVDAVEKSPIGIGPVRMAAGALQGATRAATGTMSAAAGMLDWSTPKAIGAGANAALDIAGDAAQAFADNPIQATIDGLTMAAEFVRDNASWHNVGELAGGAVAGSYIGGMTGMARSSMIGAATGTVLDAVNGSKE